MKDFILKYPLHIQLFGDDQAVASEGTTSDGAEEQVSSFTQADIDRAVSAAVKTRDTKHSEELNKAVTDAIKEQQRIATLSEEERKEEARRLAEQKVADKQKELDGKLLRVDVSEVLIKRELNPGLLEFVLGGDLSESITKIDALSEIINKQVEASIKAVVTKPGAPAKPTGGGSGMTKQEIMSIKDDAERHKQIALHPEIFKYGG